MKTFVAKEHEIEKKWHLIDAKEKVLGRMASEIATILRGKNNLFLHLIWMLVIMSLLLMPTRLF